VILAEEEIVRRLRDRDSGLAVTPILARSQIKGASVDLRLGPDMVVTRRETGLVAFDPARIEELRERLEDAWLIQAPKRLAAAYVEGQS